MAVSLVSVISISQQKFIKAEDQPYCIKPSVDMTGVAVSKSRSIPDCADICMSRGCQLFLQLKSKRRYQFKKCLTFDSTSSIAPCNYSSYDVYAARVDTDGEGDSSVCNHSKSSLVLGVQQINISMCGIGELGYQQTTL